jgi:hypothetical protein
MSQSSQNYRQVLYGSQKELTLKSRLFVLLRDELGMGRQPKVAQVLCDEIVEAVQQCYVTEEHLGIGQVLLLAPELGQSARYPNNLGQLKLRTVRLTLLTLDDIEELVQGASLDQVRMKRLSRMIHEAYGQGAALTTTQLGLLMGLSPSVVSARIRRYHDEHDELLPLRGIVEDCSPAVTHKALICKLYLEGLSTSEIAQRTHHAPKNVERYIRRLNQVRELVRYLDKAPSVGIVARILGIGLKLARAYLELLPKEELPHGVFSDGENEEAEA